jgi:hypothetical protein
MVPAKVTQFIEWLRGQFGPTWWARGARHPHTDHAASPVADPLADPLSGTLSSPLSSPVPGLSAERSADHPAARALP